MSWFWEAQDLDRLAVEADARLLDDLASRRPVAADDPAAAVLVALAREVDAVPIPPGWLVTGPAPRRSTSVRLRVRRAAAATGVAAAVGMLVVNAAAATVTGVPVGSLVNELVGSVFDGGSHAGTVDFIAARLADAEAALADGNVEVAAQILEDIKTRVDLSDPEALPSRLVDQIEQLQSRIDSAATQSAVPLITTTPSPVASDATGAGGVHDPSGQSPVHDADQGAGPGHAPGTGGVRTGTGLGPVNGTATSPASSPNTDRPNHSAEVPTSDPTITQDESDVTSPSPSSPSPSSSGPAGSSPARPSLADWSPAAPSPASADAAGPSLNDIGAAGEASPPLPSAPGPLAVPGG